MGLRDKTVSGFIWTVLGTLGSGFTNVIVTIILARLLLPSDFALIELLTIFVTISNVLVESGFSQALIRDENPSDLDQSSVFYVNLGISLLLYALLFFIAPVIATYFNISELLVLSRVAFLVIILNAFSIIQNANLNRNLRFRELSKANICAILLAGGSATIMAFAGLGIWALVANMVLNALFKPIFYWKYSKWRPRKQFSMISVKKYFNFGGFLLIQRMIDEIVTNLSSFIIGRFYTKNDLAYYSQGRKLDYYMMTPLTMVIQKVTYPILSKLQNEDDRLRIGYSQIVGIVMFVFIPITCFTLVAAKDIVLVLFGDKWVDATIFLQLFALNGLLYPLHRVCENIILVKGKTRQFLYMGMIKQALRLILILCLYKISVVALTIGFVMAGIIGSLLYVLLALGLINFSVNKFMCIICKNVISTLFSLFVVSVVCFWLPNSEFLRLGVLIVTMILSYFCMNHVLRDKNQDMVVDIVVNLIKKKS